MGYSVEKLLKEGSFLVVIKWPNLKKMGSSLRKKKNVMVILCVLFTIFICCAVILSIFQILLKNLLQKTDLFWFSFWGMKTDVERRDIVPNYYSSTELVPYNRRYLAALHFFRGSRETRQPRNTTAAIQILIYNYIVKILNIYTMLLCTHL